MKTIAYPTNVLQNLNLFSTNYFSSDFKTYLFDKWIISEDIKRKLEPVRCKKRQKIVPDPGVLQGSKIRGGR